MAEVNTKNNAIQSSKSIEVYIDTSNKGYEEAIKDPGTATWELLCLKTAPYSFGKEYNEDANLCVEGISKELKSVNMKIDLSGSVKRLDKATQFLHKHQSKLETVVVKMVDKAYADVSHTLEYIADLPTETLEFSREAGENIELSLSGEAGVFKETITEVTPTP